MERPELRWEVRDQNRNGANGLRAEAVALCARAIRTSCAELDGIGRQMASLRRDRRLLWFLSFFVEPPAATALRRYFGRGRAGVIRDR
jgi:hypothetical protein